MAAPMTIRRDGLLGMEPSERVSSRRWMARRTPDLRMKFRRMRIAGRGTSKCKGPGVRPERKPTRPQDNESQGELHASWWVRQDHGKL